MEQSLQTLKYFYLARKKELSAEGEKHLQRIFYKSASLAIGTALLIVIHGYDFANPWDYAVASYIGITFGLLVRRFKKYIAIARMMHVDKKTFEQEKALKEESRKTVSILKEITEHQKQ